MINNIRFLKEETDIMYYTYVYLDPRKPGTYVYGDYIFDHEPFYVGKGSGNRSKDHLHPSVIKFNHPRTAKIKKLWSLDLKPVIKIVEEYDNEIEAYYSEINLIYLIGSDFIENINDGPLTNMILEGINPPNHKGKTYLEIYGSEEEAEKQRKIRHDKQLEVGGYFKGHIHTDEAKRKQGEASKLGQQNGGYRTGILHSEETLAKMKKAKENDMPPAAIGYKISNASGEVFDVLRLNEFCETYNLSKSTLQKTMKTKFPAKSGKTKGWIILSTYKPTLEQWNDAKK